jgi:hypothetical protein
LKKVRAYFVEKVRAYFVAPGKFRSPAKACMLPNQPFNSSKKTVKTCSQTHYGHAGKQRAAKPKMTTILIGFVAHDNNRYIPDILNVVDMYRTIIMRRV